MDQQTLERFSLQLAHWAESAIAHGRFPFRKVETFPSLLTEGGQTRPPLVLWINRDSFMAGGVVVLPPQAAEEGVEAGKDCARALGLRHFVTWAAREIVFWEDRGGTPVRIKSLPLCAPTDSAEVFREALVLVMEELKLLSVLGALPPTELSPYYLANLCRGTLLHTLPGLAENCRAARGGNPTPEPGPEAEKRALHKAWMTLLRLFGLTAWDLLPPTVQPDGLERAMRFALDRLPKGPYQALSMREDELLLPEAEAVAFHHLFRRLVQLGAGKEHLRLRQVLEILLTCEAERLEGFPLPRRPAATGTADLLIHPDRLYSLTGRFFEIASAPILALTALARELQGLPSAQSQCESAFSLPTSARPETVIGTLADTDILPSGKQRTLAAHLRTSWPTRRFSLPSRTPRWAWEFLHLLGLAQDGATIDLHLPARWLSADYGGPLFELLTEQFTLVELEAVAAHRVRLRLKKGLDRTQTTTLIAPCYGHREVPWEQIRASHRAFLILALHLSTPLFALLGSGCLRIPSSWPERHETELYLFSRAPIGRLLWSAITDGRALPAGPRLPGEALRRGLPIPAPEILKNLHLFCSEKGGEVPRQGDFDKELSLWLDVKIEAQPPRSEKKRIQAPKSSSLIDLAEEVFGEVFVDGVPRFPEQYLYDYYRPTLRAYTFSGPLAHQEEFFGRHTLRDRQGTLLEVEGRETAQALLLASFGERTSVDLPTDRHLTAAILDRYRRDLRSLHITLAQRVHARMADPRDAEELTANVWSSAHLPPLDLLDF